MSKSTQSSTATLETKYVCVNCMATVDSLYTEYSKEVIRITDCPSCNEVADKYIEYDPVLILNDLILQYSAAYRHILLNTKFNAYVRLATIFVLADAYNKWIQRQTNLQSARVYDLEWHFYEALVMSSIECSAHLLVAYGLSQYFVDKTKMHSFKFYISRSVVGFFGNVFVVFSIIWHLHEHFSYRLLMRLFIFISQLQVQRTLCPSLSTMTSIFIVLVSIGTRLGVGLALGHLFSNLSSTT